MSAGGRLSIWSTGSQREGGERASQVTPGKGWPCCGFSCLGALLPSGGQRSCYTSHDPQESPTQLKSHQAPRVNGAEAEKPGLEATGAWMLRLLTAGAHGRATGTCLLWKVSELL